MLNGHNELNNKNVITGGGELLFMQLSFHLTGCLTNTYFISITAKAT